jgi:hypothetical protein
MLAEVKQGLFAMDLTKSVRLELDLMPIQHVIQSHSDSLDLFQSASVSTFILGLLGFSLLLTYIQAQQNLGLLKKSVSQLLPELKTLIRDDPYLSTEVKKRLQQEDRNPVENLRVYLSYFSRDLKKCPRLQEEFLLLRSAQERFANFERSQKKIALLIFGNSALLVGFLMALRNSENPEQEMAKLLIPAGVLVIYLGLLFFLRRQKFSPPEII